MTRREDEEETTVDTNRFFLQLGGNTDHRRTEILSVSELELWSAEDQFNPMRTFDITCGSIKGGRALVNLWSEDSNLHYNAK